MSMLKECLARCSPGKGLLFISPVRRRISVRSDFSVYIGRLPYAGVPLLFSNNNLGAGRIQVLEPEKKSDYATFYRPANKNISYSMNRG